MKKNIRTDLACEAREDWSGGEKPGLPGLFFRREERSGFGFEVVEVRSDEAEKELCKPKGRYVTMELDALLRREEDAFPRAVTELAAELRGQLSLGREESALVVGLGNPDITPDAVGTLALEHVLVTRHLRDRLGEAFRAFRSVSAFRSGVLGTTGAESAELTAAVAEKLRPHRVIAVDALAAREPRRLCRTVQISNAGIVPGSGVGNHRSALDAAALGVPVIAVGVPTVVEAAALCSAAAPEGTEGLFVTPRDIDARVRDAARLVGYAIDLALHPGLTLSDVDMLLS